MTLSSASITLSEWQSLAPQSCPALAGRFLDGAPAARRLAEGLSERGLVGFTELRNGLLVKAYSHVGRIRIGDLEITIRPKIESASLLHLLRYAYGLRPLHQFADAKNQVENCGLEELLIVQLNAEVRELVARGLLRSYVATSDRLTSPRGRINLMQIAADGGRISASLPCRHFPRIEDTLLNRVLLAGLVLAAQMSGVVAHRRESRRLAAVMEEQVSPIRLDATALERADRQLNRLTKAYSPALTIIQLLLNAKGVVFDGESTPSTLPGFLFDMNAFFQSLMCRFLRDNLPTYRVREECALTGMISYSPGFNPRRRQAPTPRPDYVVTRHDEILSILDAKYRDLWNTPLPREMLYQLVAYAVSLREKRQSSILYPTTDSAAREARLDVRDPFYGRPIGQVCLRPVHLPTIEKLVMTNSAKARRLREELAQRFAFGERP